MKQVIKEIPFKQYLQSNGTKAVIFDLDGTLLDNNSYHLQSWLTYLNEKKIKLTRQEFDANMNGRTNKDAIEYLFGKGLSPENITRITEEKEAVYRKIYAPYIREVEGLTSLLEFLKSEKIKMAIATSGIQPNIDFMFSYLAIKKYFEVIVNSSHIKNGKPDPEIYRVTAEKLQIPTAHCLVFEDSLPGIESALKAGMKVIALATSHAPDELEKADGVINTYEDLVL